MNDYGHALKLEFILKKEFNLERYGLGGIIDKDFIKKTDLLMVYSLILSKYINYHYDYIDKFISNILNNYYYEKNIITIQDHTEIADKMNEEFISFYNNLKKEH